MNNQNISASLMAVFQVVLGVAVLAAWQASSGTLIDAFLISDPKSIFNKLYIWFSSGSIWVHIWATVYSTSVGFLIGASAGIIAGVWLGLSPTLSRLLDPYIWALNASPKVALAPLFVLWFGLGIQSKIALAAVLVVFLVFVNTFAGVRQVDSDLVDTIKLMGAKKRKILTTVILPDASSWIFVGIQTAIPYALIGTIIGEMIASNRGLGYLVQRSGSEFDTAGVFAALFIISVIGVLLNQLFVISQAPFQKWKKISR
jgi:NitT/TauT family transport system permease protein